MSSKITPEQLLSHQETLLNRGVNVRALVHRPNPESGALKAGGGEKKTSLEMWDLGLDWWRVGRGFIDAILEDTMTPSSWTDLGPLPSGIDGLRQTQIVNGIVTSAEQGKAFQLSR